MTEYKIVLYYDKPIPEYFIAAMEQQLKAAVESGILFGYVFEKEELTGAGPIKKSIQKESGKIKEEFKESLKDEKARDKDDTPGHNPGAEKGAPVVHDTRKARRAKPEHKEIRPDSTDSGKKEG